MLIAVPAASTLGKESQNTINLTLAGKEESRRVAAPARVGSSNKMNRIQSLYRVWGCFPGWLGIGRLLWFDSGTSLAISGILQPAFGASTGISEISSLWS